MPHAPFAIPQFSNQINLNKMKNSLVSTGISGLLSLVAFAVASPSYAASVDLSSWSSVGDVTKTPNQANLNSGTLNTAFTGGGAGSVEEFLNITPASLESAVPNNFFGSAIKQTFTGVNAGDVFSFNWNFSTTDNDKAFVTINNTVALLSGSSPFSYLFSTAGNYNIGIGLVDVDDSIGQSTLSVSNANFINANPQPVPEPATILGSITALGFGVKMARRYRKKSAV
jgi:hypothetical protein